FLNHDAAQIRKNSRFDPVAATRVFPDGDARRPDLAGDDHFNPSPKLAPEVPTDVSPVLPRKLSESNPQSSRGSVKKSGGQSSSLASLASLNFRSRAGVATYERLVLGGGIATMERWPLPSRMMYSP